MSPVYIQKMSSICSATEEPDYKELIPNPTLRRRMSRVVKMGVASGLECLAGYPTEDVEAIITATGLGCLADTEKFMNNLLDNNEQLLNPTAFIQSTFNTVGAQIALMCKNHSYNVTYAHRNFSFESALLDGILRISEGNKRVLVGAFDEITPTGYAIQNRLGLYRTYNAGEGSQFFLLSGQADADTIATVYAPYMFTGDEQATKQHLTSYLETFNLTETDICFIATANKGTPLLPHVKQCMYKELCGEYHTASAFALWHTAKTLSAQCGGKRYALVYNQWNKNHSFILLSFN
ncbi:beta-ketoacyl synthase chain length factor [Bacteroides sp. 519]|uniref:beta-ketoacyl synthase chain length factor n=1 Tax=Bacteroides sp. 519 TaxID=2302937 RepID=UPI0013D30879|nr:3-oxoacyl-ACP synthase [Bacteroides sp. 519]